MPFKKNVPFIFDLEMFSTALSKKNKKRLVEFVSKYRPEGNEDQDAMPVLNKIRRQEPDGTYFTDKLIYDIQNSFFIENDKQNPDRCWLHIADHTNHLEGGMGRVVSIPFVVEVNLKSKIVIIHRDRIENRPIERIKTSKKETYEGQYEKSNKYLLNEFLAMPKYSRSKARLHERQYGLFRENSSPKNRFIMPDKGVSLTSLFAIEGWKNYSTIELLTQGTNKILAAEHLCRAVARIHRHGYVHRDIKPDNVLIKKDTKDRLHVCLGDFAFFKHKFDVCEYGGTRLYLPKENLIKTDKNNLPSVDVYALCLTLLQWLFFKDFSTICSENVDHLRHHTTKGKIIKEGYKITNERVIPTDPLLIPLINLLYQGLELDPTQRPTARQLTDCLRDIRKELQLRAESKEEEVTSRSQLMKISFNA